MLHSTTIKRNLFELSIDEIKQRAALMSTECHQPAHTDRKIQEENMFHDHIRQNSDFVCLRLSISAFLFSQEGEKSSAEKKTFSFRRECQFYQRLESVVLSL